MKEAIFRIDEVYNSGYLKGSIYSKDNKRLYSVIGTDKKDLYNKLVMGLANAKDYKINNEIGD